MKLVRLIYTSRFCNDKFDTNQLARINESSQKNNTASEITGILIFGEDYFLQCLEGDREAVTKTYNRIALDPRHDSITLLSLNQITKRDFSEWKMRFVLLTEANSHLTKEFSPSSRFNPYELSAENAYELLKGLKK